MKPEQPTTEMFEIHRKVEQYNLYIDFESVLDSGYFDDDDLPTGEELAELIESAIYRYRDEYDVNIDEYSQMTHALEFELNWV